MVPTGIPSVVATVAVLKAGMVHVGVNVLFKEVELGHILLDSGARGLIVDAALLPLVDTLDDPAALEHIVVVGDAPAGTTAYGDLIERPAPGPQTQQLEPSARAALIYTGGTTGMPKGAVHDHENLVTQTLIGSSYFGMTPDDRVMGALPTFMLPPFYSSAWYALGSGATLFLERRFDAARVLERIRSERLTFMVATKTMLFLFNELPASAADDLSSMRMFACGGMPQPPEVRRAFEQRFARPTLHIYGLSECANVVAGTPPETPAQLREETFDSVGRPLEGISIRVVREDGSPADVDEPGELWIGDDGSGRWKPMSGYVNRPAETSKALEDGWYRSGDVGRIDAHGFVYVRGRAQELIKVSGWSVFPAEIEALLAGEEGVEQVAVVPVPDARAGQRPVAFVKPRPGATVDPATLMARVEHGLAKFKRLRDVRVVDELPTNLYGKVQKHRLTELYLSSEAATDRTSA